MLKYKTLDYGVKIKKKMTEIRLSCSYIHDLYDEMGGIYLDYIPVILVCPFGGEKEYFTLEQGSYIVC